MNFEIIVNSIPALLEGAGLTIQLTVLSVLIGLACSVPIALVRVSRNPLLWAPAYGYIFFFRGTPLLAQLYLVYYGSGQFVDVLKSVGLWHLFREAYFCALLTLTLNTAAYTAEILRGAIMAVPRGEIEAARACGMSRALLYRRIILPKAFRLALPAYGNEVVFLFQATSLVSLVTLMDITGVARVVAARRGGDLPGDHLWHPVRLQEGRVPHDGPPPPAPRRRRRRSGADQHRRAVIK
jgi:octopine/nopaline transport system permease protein/arginine/ornithine transport system permease protein